MIHCIVSITRRWTLETQPSLFRPSSWSPTMEASLRLGLRCRWWWIWLLLILIMIMKMTKVIKECWRMHFPGAVCHHRCGGDGEGGGGPPGQDLKFKSIFNFKIRTFFALLPKRSSWGFLPKNRFHWKSLPWSQVAGEQAGEGEEHLRLRDHGRPQPASQEVGSRCQVFG